MRLLFIFNKVYDNNENVKNKNLFTNKTFYIKQIFNIKIKIIFFIC